KKVSGDQSGTRKKPRREPIVVSRPIVDMKLVHNLSEHRVRVLLDTGSQIPVVSLSKAREWELPENHCTRLSFELTDMDEECDIILPQWWMTQHQPSNLFGRPEEIAFDS
ncbi:hypothetical protein QBC38DRAFT_347285, partial [Podospora fimiseda]